MPTRRINEALNIANVTPGRRRSSVHRLDADTRRVGVAVQRNTGPATELRKVQVYLVISFDNGETWETHRFCEFWDGEHRNERSRALMLWASSNGPVPGVGKTDRLVAFEIENPVLEAAYKLHIDFFAES